jgi:glyoxylase-like metal-dependent hydrolase (beta-lactamase superfamily II)
MSTLLPEPIRLVVKTVGEVRIHTFISAYTDDNIANATHIIESPKKLVLIDGQFLTPYAMKFRAYANSIGKPIDRLYLSHRHPDHWFGLQTAFSDISVYALPETIKFLHEHGEDSRKDHWKLGGLAPQGTFIPQYEVEPGDERIDGVHYLFSKVVNTEIDFLLAIRLPDLGVCIAQDLIYSGTHLYITKDMQHWIEVLEQMLLSDDELFLPGHGLPADKNEVARNIEYLAAAMQAVGNGLSNDAFKQYLIERYPERKCAGIFDIYIPRLFDNASDY